MKSFFSQLVLSTLLILLSTHAHSSPSKTPFTENTKNHLTISSIEVVDLTSQYENYNDGFSYGVLGSNWISNPTAGNLDKIDFIVDKVINIGQKIWNVVEKGRPVSNYSSSSATALPANTTSWEQLDSWQSPRGKVINVIYKNAYGIEVVHFTYRIILLYGGSANGVGKYIGYASVEPLEMTTAYMYTFNAKASVDAVFNMGTRLNPIGGMILNISWTVETVLKKSTMTHTYNLDGRGNISVPTEGIIYFNNLK